MTNDCRNPERLRDAANDAELDQHIDLVSGEVQGYLERYFEPQIPSDRVPSDRATLEDPQPSNALERLIGPAKWAYETQAYEETICVPVRDMLSRASKKWRPIFGVLLLNALNESETKRVEASDYVELLTLATELIHTGALIIDDIEDDSELRRGDQCIHLRYGNDVAINAANFLYFAPFLNIQTHPCLNDRQRLKIYSLMFNLFLRGHVGQASDIWRSHALSAESFEHWFDNNAESRVLQSYADKTSCALDASVDLVSAILNVDESLTVKMREFSGSVGVAFQILDDVKNFSSHADWTKTVGEDIASGKMTYVLCKAIRELEQTESEFLRDVLLCEERRSDAVELEKAIELVRGSGVLEHCEATAYEMFEEAWDSFCECVPDSLYRRCIRRLCVRVFAGLNSV